MLGMEQISDQQKATWDKLEKKLSEGMRLAEQGCRKLRMGEVEWSPQYHFIQAQLTFWNTLIRKKQGRCIKMKYLYRVGRKANLSHCLNVTMEEAVMERKRLYQARREVKQNASNLRDKWIESLAMAKAAEGQLSVE